MVFRLLYQGLHAAVWQCFIVTVVVTYVIVIRIGEVLIDVAFVMSIRNVEERFQLVEQHFVNFDRQQKEANDKLNLLTGKVSDLESNSKKYVHDNAETMKQLTKSLIDLSDRVDRKNPAGSGSAFQEQPGAAKKPRRSSQRSFQAPGRAAMPQVENRSTLKWNEVSPEIWKWLKDHLGLLVPPTDESDMVPPSDKKKAFVPLTALQTELFYIPVFRALCNNRKVDCRVLKKAFEEVHRDAEYEPSIAQQPDEPVVQDGKKKPTKKPKRSVKQGFWKHRIDYSESQRLCNM